MVLNYDALHSSDCPCVHAWMCCRAGPAFLAEMYNGLGPEYAGKAFQHPIEPPVLLCCMPQTLPPLHAALYELRYLSRGIWLGDAVPAAVHGS